MSTAPIPIAFVASATGPWRVTSTTAISGDSLPHAARLAITPRADGPADWVLRGVTSNLRYTTEPERATLTAVQPGLGRPAARRAALIPITKTPAWWDLAQDSRRAIMDGSGHLAIGLDYLPAVARRLIHCRDLGEPFDFLTWFEFAPEDEPGFDALLGRLRATEEWRHVEREVEIRLTREP